MTVLSIQLSTAKVFGVFETCKWTFGRFLQFLQLAVVGLLIFAKNRQLKFVKRRFLLKKWDQPGRDGACSKEFQLSCFHITNENTTFAVIF
jgi:hypothetical protein